MITGRDRISLTDLLSLKPPFSDEFLAGKSPSAVMAAYIVAEGLMSAPTSNTDWPLCISYISDLRKDAGAIYDTNPIMEGKLPGGVVVEHYGIQIAIRSSVYETGWRKIYELTTLLDEVNNVELELGEYIYVLENCSRRSGPAYAGVDRERKQCLFTVNFIITINLLV